jgi:hypothetical protein
VTRASRSGLSGQRRVASLAVTASEGHSRPHPSQQGTGRGSQLSQRHPSLLGIGIRSDPATRRPISALTRYAAGGSVPTGVEFPPVFSFGIARLVGRYPPAAATGLGGISSLLCGFYRMKKDTVRPQDRLDAQVLRERFDLREE